MDRRPETAAAPRAARILSVAAHPFVLSPLTVALVTRNWRWTVLIGVATILPVTAVILWNLRRGVWSDFDVSRREQRSGLYWAAIPLFVAAAFLVPAPPWFFRSMMALVAILVVALAASRFLKTSLHMMFAAFCTVVVLDSYPLSLAVSVPLLAALAWARWRLQHHTPLELLAGTLLGAAAGLYTIS